MSQAETETELRFDPPGPGSWKLDAVHFPRPVTRYWAETHPEPFKSGFGDFTSFYGMLIDTLDTAYPNGFSYTTMRPAAPEEFRRGSSVRRRSSTASSGVSSCANGTRLSSPASIAAHRAIQAVDPDALDGEELSAYLERCHEHHAAMITQHMRFTAAAMIPTGDFLAHVGAGPGCRRRSCSACCAAPRRSRLAPPASSKISSRRSAADPRASELLESDGDPAEVLDALRALDGDAGRGGERLSRPSRLAAARRL